MNYIKHLTGFFEKVAIDKTLNPTHVSLYIALFQFWNCNRFKNPISISRDEVMRISKISSKATYHKCLKNLHTLGYINYEPSYNPFKGSHVFLFNFSKDLKPSPKSERKLKNERLIEQVSEQALNKSCTSSGTSTEQALVPSINYINNTNISNKKNVSNLDKQAKNFEEINNSSNKIVIPSAVEVTQKEKSSVKKEKEEMLETLDDANRQMLQTFANSDENQIKNSWQKSSAKKEEKEMPDEKLEGKSNTPNPAFADYNAKQTETSRQKSSAKKEEKFLVTSSGSSRAGHLEPVIPSVSSRAQSRDERRETRELNPTTEEVKTYFQQNNFPELEAIKFFNYFSSNGWLVGGKTPMVDWKAAAQNWILNSINFNHNTDTTPTHHRQNLNATTDKNYAEPL